MQDTTTKGFQYAHIPETLIDEKYKYFSDWVYKAIKGKLNAIRKEEEVAEYGEVPQQSRKMKYFVASFDADAFACYEMENSPQEEQPEYRFTYFDKRYLPLIDIPKDNIYNRNPELVKIRNQAMQTAIIQLHCEGAFAGTIASYPCEIYLAQNNNIYNEGYDAELFLTITGKEGETPSAADLPAFPNLLFCTDYYNDETLNYIFSLHLSMDKPLKLHNNTLTKHTLPKLHLPSGRIIAADPFANGHKEAFEQTVAPGIYEINTYKDKNGKIALAALFFYSIENDYDYPSQKVIRWEPARTRQYQTTYTATSGFGVFMDEQTLQAIQTQGKLSADGAIAEAWFHDTKNSKHAALFRTGNGTCSSFFGYNNKNEIICLVTDFGIL